MNEWLQYTYLPLAALFFLTVHYFIKWGNGIEWGEAWMTDRFIYCIHFINSKKISWGPVICWDLKYLQNLYPGQKNRCSDGFKQREGIFGKSVALKIGGPDHASWNVKGFHQNYLLNHKSRCGKERWKLSIAINSSPNPFFCNINHFKIIEKLGESP